MRQGSRIQVSIIISCVIITFAYNLFSSMLRAVGNSRTPLYALVIASLINIGLDILFVKGLSMGVKGAAYATVIAQFISAVFLAIYIKRKCPALNFSAEYLRLDKTILSELFTTGLSMAMMLVITNIGTVAMQGAVNSLGTSTITGHTSARKFHDLCMLPFGTICTATATFVSQNFGARKIHRIKRGIKISMLMGSVWAAFTFAVMMLLGRTLIHTLTGTTDATVLSVAMKYLYWNVPFYVILNGLLIMRNSLQALGSKIIPITASMLELTGKFVCVFIFVPWVEYLGICLVEPVTWIACAIIVVAGFYYKLPREDDVSNEIREDNIPQKSCGIDKQDRISAFL